MGTHQKKYKAILTCIKTKECSWESNFDRFQTILYKHTMGENRPNAPERAQADKESGNRKRYYKDYNRPEGCHKTSPHPVWFGSGSSAVKFNHKGANEHPEQLRKYINKELHHGAVMGPYKKIPFMGSSGISPLSTRPKKGSPDRRVILDPSFPVGNSVNDGIPKHSYLGMAIKLT